MIIRLALIAVLLIASPGCATTGENDARPQRADPLERINRGTYAFNKFFDRILLKPVAKGYSYLPKPMRTGVGNFFNNLSTPIDIVNNLLQGKPRGAGTELARLVFNSTIGIGGLFDPATPMGLKEYEEDFGQTLGVWGVPTSPYLVLPFLGPSTIRDGFGTGADIFLRPLTYYENTSVRDKLIILFVVDTRESLFDAEKALEDAFDEYAFVRDAYLQRRRFLLYDGNPPDDDLDEFEDDIDEEDLSDYE